MSTPGPWLEDADLVWKNAGQAATAQYSSQVQSGSAYNPTWATAFADTWNVAPQIVEDLGFYQSAGELSASDAGADLGWSVMWVGAWTVLTPFNTTVDSSTLPASVYSGGMFTDPNVVGVEWEPTSTPIQQALRVYLQGGNGKTVNGIATGQTYYLHRAEVFPGSDGYAPGYQSAATISALPILAELHITGPNNEVVVTDLPLPLTGTYTLPLTMLDQWTETRTPPPTSGWTSVRYPFEADLTRGYRPRYRLLYEAPTVAVRKVVRLFPRDGDGYGF